MTLLCFRMNQNQQRVKRKEMSDDHPTPPLSLPTATHQIWSNFLPFVSCGWHPIKFWGRPARPNKILQVLAEHQSSLLGFCDVCSNLRLWQFYFGTWVFAQWGVRVLASEGSAMQWARPLQRVSPGNTLQKGCILWVWEADEISSIGPVQKTPPGLFCYCLFYHPRKKKTTTHNCDWIKYRSLPGKIGMIGT